MAQQSLETIFANLIKEIEDKGIKASRQSARKGLQEGTIRVGQGQVNDVEELLHKYLGEPILSPGQEIDNLSPIYTEALGAMPKQFRYKDQPLYGQAAPPQYIFGVWIPFTGGATLKLLHLNIRMLI